MPDTTHLPTVAIIGAGLSGLTAAGRLRDAGFPVTLFEKSRGHGGRAATRRTASATFDHGAQYFTARDPVFRRAVADWEQTGVVTTWGTHPGRVESGHCQASPDAVIRYVGVPGMSALGRHLGTGLRVWTGTRVTPPQRVASRWLLEADTGEQLGAFDLLVVSAPAPQTADLLACAAPNVAAKAARVSFAPSWTVMIRCESPLPLAFNALFFADGALGWAANNGSKPGRGDAAWVLQATPGWSRGHLETPADEVAGVLLDEYCAATGAAPGGLEVAASHRWLYARAEAPLGRDYLWDPMLGVGLCGDWCRGSRLEDAYLSGRGLAEEVIRRFAPPRRGITAAPGSAPC